MTHDNDLIRRGDVLDAMCKGPRTVQERIDAIRSITAQPDPRDEVIEGLTEALRELLQLNDGVPMMGIEATRRIETARAALAAAKAVMK